MWRSERNYKIGLIIEGYIFVEMLSQQTLMTNSIVRYLRFKANFINVKTMKTLSITFFLLFCIAETSLAQIEYEGTINSKYKSIQLDDGSFKYVKYDKKKQTIFIFNMDNTLWRKVQLPLPENHQLDEVKNISQHIFNKNDEVEIVYSCVVYTPPKNYEDPSEGFGSMSFTLNVITEKGESLLKVDNSNEMEIIHTNKLSKMLVYRHIGQGYSSSDETLIYNLPSLEKK